MIRRLIILLLIVGCVFGDTIKYKSSLFVRDTKNNIEFLGVGSHKRICFKTNNDIDCIPCKTVKEIFDSSNQKIDFDCNKRSYYGQAPRVEGKNFKGVAVFVFLTYFLYNIIPVLVN